MRRSFVILFIFVIFTLILHYFATTAVPVMTLRPVSIW
jgi:hypothetical protein